GQTEWPLSGTQQMALAVWYAGDAPFQGQFFYTEESGGTWNAAEPLTESHVFERPFGPFVGRVAVTTTGVEGDAEAGVRITFLRGGAEQRSVFLSHGTGDGDIHLTVDGDVTLDLSLPPTPDPQIAPQNGIRIDVHRGQTETGDATVSITFSRSLAQVSQNVIALDAVYDGIAVGSWVAIERPRKGRDPASGGAGGDRGLARVITTVQDVRIVSLAAFGISGKVTQLVLDDAWLDDADTSLGHIRDATVYARGTALSLATEP